ncbi:hypothetical protein IGI04_019734, partial [Brassica rapa subsp. trilocularis]
PVDGEIVKKHNECLGIDGLRYKGGFRQDKAVNRFTRLRVKRAKHETMASENNSNNKIMFFLDGSCTPANMKLLLPIEQGSSSMIAALHYTLCLHSELFMSITRWKLSSLPHDQRHGTVKGTMDVKELVLLLAKNSMNHQSLLLVKDCATPPALKKEVSAAGERDKEGREVGEKKTEGG